MILTLLLRVGRNMDPSYTLHKWTRQGGILMTQNCPLDEDGNPSVRIIVYLTFRRFVQALLFFVKISSAALKHFTKKFNKENNFHKI